MDRCPMCGDAVSEDAVLHHCPICGSHGYDECCFLAGTHTVCPSCLMDDLDVEPDTWDDTWDD